MMGTVSEDISGIGDPSVHNNNNSHDKAVTVVEPIKGSQQSIDTSQKHVFGGFPHDFYQEVIEFVKYEKLPHRFEYTVQKGNSLEAKRALFLKSTFTIKDGLLLQDGRYIIRKGDAESILEELHKQLLHPSHSMWKFLHPHFTYGTHGHHGKMINDMKKVVDKCKSCRHNWNARYGDLLQKVAFSVIPSPTSDDPMTHLFSVNITGDVPTVVNKNKSVPLDENFSGFPLDKYEAIMKYLDDGTPVNNKWKFDKTSFALRDGLLTQRDKYIIVTGESRSILKDIHIKAGHCTISRLRSLCSLLTYGCVGSKTGRFSNDCAKIVASCEMCEGVGLVAVGGGTVKKLRVSVVPTPDGPQRFVVEVSEVDDTVDGGTIHGVIQDCQRDENANRSPDGDVAEEDKDVLIINKSDACVVIDDVTIKKTPSRAQSKDQLQVQGEKKTQKSADNTDESKVLATPNIDVPPMLVVEVSQQGMEDMQENEMADLSNNFNSDIPPVLDAVDANEMEDVVSSSNIPQVPMNMKSDGQSVKSGEKQVNKRKRTNGKSTDMSTQQVVKEEEAKGAQKKRKMQNGEKKGMVNTKISAQTNVNKKGIKRKLVAGDNSAIATPSAPSTQISNGEKRKIGKNNSPVEVEPKRSVKREKDDNQSVGANAPITTSSVAPSPSSTPIVAPIPCTPTSTTVVPSFSSTTSTVIGLAKRFHRAQTAPNFTALVAYTTSVARTGTNSVMPTATGAINPTTKVAPLTTDTPIGAPIPRTPTSAFVVPPSSTVVAPSTTVPQNRVKEEVVEEHPKVLVEDIPNHNKDPKDNMDTSGSVNTVNTSTTVTQMSRTVAKGQHDTGVISSTSPPMQSKEVIVDGVVVPPKPQQSTPPPDGPRLVFKTTDDVKREQVEKEEEEQENEQHSLPAQPEFKAHVKRESLPDGSSTQPNSTPTTQNSVVHVVPTPYGNIKCPPGFVPRRFKSSEVSLKKMLNKGVLFIRASMERGNSPNLGNNQPTLITGELLSIVETEHGDIFLPEGFQDTSFSVVENEDVEKGLTIEITIRIERFKKDH